MLDLNTKFEMNGVTLYRDFDDTDVFYYMPALPHIAFDNGDPRFSLIVFEKGGVAGEEESGGFLTLVVSTDLGDVKEKLLRDLKRQFGAGVRLASVDFTEGSVRLLGLDIGEGDTGTAAAPTDTGPAGIRFIEKIESTQTPMLSGDNRAFFSTRLSEEGAALVMGMLEGAPDAIPFGVSYDLSFTGLLTVQDLKIEIDFERSYNFMRQRFGLDAIVVQAEIDNVIEDLRTNESIKIIDTVRTLDQSTPEAMTARQTAINTLVKELATGALFRPTLTVGQPSTNETQVFGSSAESVGTTGGIMDMLRTGGIAGGVLAGMAAAHNPQGVTSGTEAPAGGGTPPPAAPPTPTQAQRAQGQQVNTAMGTPRATFVMRNLSQSERRTVTYDLSRTAVQQRKYPLVNSLSFMASPVVLRRKVAHINLNHPFFKRLDIDIEASAMDFAAEGVTKLTVDFRYGQRPDGTPKEEVSVILQNPDDKKSFTFFADDTGTKSYEYRITAHFRPDFGIGDESLTVTGDWVQSDARLISAHSQMVARRINFNLRLPRVLPADLLEVRSVVRYTDADGTVEDSEEVILTPESKSQNVVIRYSENDDFIEVTAKAVFADGNEVALPTEKRPDPDNARADDVVEFFVKRRAALDFDIIMQDPLDELASVIVDYEVLQNDEVVNARSVQIEQPLVRQVISEPLATEDSPAVLRIRERHLFSSGGIEDHPWKQATDHSIIAGIPAEDVRSVAVRYVGPPMDVLGINGILVDLKYTDPQGNSDFTQSETLFVNNTEVVDWKFRMADRHATTFIYRLTLFLDNGEQRSGEDISYSGNDLILRANF